MYVASHFTLNVMIWYEQRVMSKTRNALQVSEENEGCILITSFRSLATLLMAIVIHHYRSMCTFRQEQVDRIPSPVSFT